MYRLKVPQLAALGAAVAIRALAAAPSPSARPRTPDCKGWFALADEYWNVWQLLVATGYGSTQIAMVYKRSYISTIDHANDEGCF